MPPANIDPTPRGIGRVRHCVAYVAYALPRFSYGAGAQEKADHRVPTTSLYRGPSKYYPRILYHLPLTPSPKPPAVPTEIINPVAYLGDLPWQPSPPRRQRLDQLGSYISQRYPDPVRLVFICTHNSRRSIIAQVWAAAAAAWFGMEGVETFSGGTEVTAFHPHAVAALRRAGFAIESGAETDNPTYTLRIGQDSAPLTLWSKVFDAPDNPARGFAAVMTCSEADENCPYVPGTDLRLALPFDDPKVFDGTPEEQRTYDERVREIGREIVYTFSRARHQLMD